MIPITTSIYEDIIIINLKHSDRYQKLRIKSQEQYRKYFLKTELVSQSTGTYILKSISKVNIKSGPVHYTKILDLGFGNNDFWL